MPKRARVLTALEVRRLAGVVGQHAVGDPPGLVLRVAGGAASWVLRLMVRGKRHELGLGGYPGVPLAEARAQAKALRAEVARGGDPVAARHQARIERRKPTFAACCEAFLIDNSIQWRNAKHRDQWTNTLRQYCEPFASRRIDLVNTDDVLAVLRPIWASKTETAVRLRGRIERVLDWAKARGLRDGDNPARWRGHLDAILPAPGKVRTVEHHAALPWRELPSFMAALRQQQGVAARALELVILTACRSGEVRGATWGEIDLERALWVIPANRMKAGREHRVPLSDAAVRLLEAQPRTAGADVVFPGRGGGALSDMSLTAVLRRMGRGDLTVHGFRSSFRNWAAEATNYPREVCEQALAHKLPDAVEAAYLRSDFLDKRRALMEEWAAFCASGVKGGAWTF